MPASSRNSYREKEERKTQYEFGKATVKIYGDYDQDKLKQATAEFLKKAELQRRKRKSNTALNLQDCNAS